MSGRPALSSARTWFTSLNAPDPMSPSRPKTPVPNRRSAGPASPAVVAVLLLLAAVGAQAGPDKTDEELRREAAIAEFASRTKAANYPALFDQAAREFNVPADILKGVAFAETRWEHLTWPPGETVSPENGMPRPYGIMSLWDNPFFGHSLVEAATLIGKTPEELKIDPLLNIRGAAAWLRQLYDQNPKPAGTTAADIESWREAIRKYCGIPEPDLSAQHALKVYTFINQGYHQFGIEWDGRPVNLDPIRAETSRIVREERARRAALAAAASNSPPVTPLAAGELSPGQAPPFSTAVLPAPEGPERRKRFWVAGLFAALAVALALIFRRSKTQ